MGTGIGLSASGWTKVKWSVISAVGGLIAVALVTFGWGIFKSGARAQAEEFIVITVGEQVTKQLNKKIDGVENKVDNYAAATDDNTEKLGSLTKAVTEQNVLFQQQTEALNAVLDRLPPPENQ